MKRKNKTFWQTVLWIFCAWVLLVLLHASDKDISFSVLGYSYGLDHIAIQQSTAIIIGDFTATEDNIGIIGVRLDTTHLGEMNKIRFRLKEKNSKDWYYENDYRVTKLPNTPLFPFGFPIVKDSKGKEFIFELQMVAGAPGNELRVNTRYPVFDAYYKFYKNELLRNPIAFMTFLIKKFILCLSNTYAMAFLSICLIIPLVVYWAGKRIGLRWPITYLPFILIIFLITYNVLITFKTSESVIVTLTVLLLFCIRYMRTKGKTSFIFAFIYLLLTSILYFVGSEQPIEKAAIWGYVFLVVGLFQRYWELRPKR